VSWLADLYRTEILDAGKQALFLLLVAFVLTFLFIRLSVRMIRAEVSWWPGNINAGGVHLHHVVFGTVLMLGCGVLAFAPAGWQSPWWDLLGAGFGVGAALVLDEFALILHLEDVYWSEKGRTSVDAVVLAAGVTLLLVVGALPFGLEDMAPAEEQGRWGYLLTVLLNGSLVALALLKGRIWLGVLGLVFPLFALLGALRLGRPHSPWARWRYREGSRKLLVAARRAVRHEQRGERWKTRLFDAVAGRPDPPPAAVAPAGAPVAPTVAVTPAPVVPRPADPPDTGDAEPVRVERGG
jgi:lysyl-tRNA synthetase, class II